MKQLMRWILVALILCSLAAAEEDAVTAEDIQDMNSADLNNKFTLDWLDDASKMSAVQDRWDDLSEEHKVAVFESDHLNQFRNEFENFATGKFGIASLNIQQGELTYQDGKLTNRGRTIHLSDYGADHSITALADGGFSINTHVLHAVDIRYRDGTFALDGNARVQFTKEGGSATSSKGVLIVTGEATGTLETGEGLVTFDNYEGRLSMTEHGDFAAAHARVSSPTLYVEGRFVKQGDTTHIYALFNGKPTDYIDKREGLAVQTIGNGFVEIHRQQPYPPVVSGEMKVTEEQITAGEIQYQESDGKVWYWRAEGGLQLHTEGSVQVTLPDGRLFFEGESGAALDYHELEGGVTTRATGRFVLEDTNTEVDTRVYAGKYPEQIVFLKQSMAETELGRFLSHPQDDGLFARVTKKITIGQQSVLGAPFGTLVDTGAFDGLVIEVAVETGALHVAWTEESWSDFAALIGEEHFAVIEKNFFLDTGQGNFLGVSTNGMGRFENGQLQIGESHVFSPARVFSTLGTEMTFLTKEEERAARTFLRILANAQSGNVQQLQELRQLQETLLQNPALQSYLEQEYAYLHVQVKDFNDPQYVRNLAEYFSLTQGRNPALQQGAMIAFYQSEILRLEEKGDARAMQLRQQLPALTVSYTDQLFAEKRTFLTGEIARQSLRLHELQKEQEMLRQKIADHGMKILPSVTVEELRLVEVEQEMRQLHGAMTKNREDFQAVVQQQTGMTMTMLLQSGIGDIPKGLEVGPEVQYLSKNPEIAKLLAWQELQYYEEAGIFDKAVEHANGLGQRDLALYFKGQAALQKGNVNLALHAFNRVPTDSEFAGAAKTMLGELQGRFTNLIRDGLFAELGKVEQLEEARLSKLNLLGPVKLVTYALGAGEAYTELGDIARTDLLRMDAGLQQLDRLQKQGYDVLTVARLVEEGKSPALRELLLQVYGTEIDARVAANPSLSKANVIAGMMASVQMALENADVQHFILAANGRVDLEDWRFQTGSGYVDTAGLQRTWGDTAIDLADLVALGGLQVQAVKTAVALPALASTFPRLAAYGTEGVATFVPGLERAPAAAQFGFEVAASIGLDMAAPGAGWLVLPGRVATPTLTSAMREGLQNQLVRELGEGAAQDIMRKLHLEHMNGQQLVELLQREGVQNIDAVMNGAIADAAKNPAVRKELEQAIADAQNPVVQAELLMQARKGGETHPLAKIMDEVEHAEQEFIHEVSSRHVDDLDAFDVAALNERYGLSLEFDPRSRVVYATEQERQFLEAIGIDTTPTGFAPGEGTVGGAMAKRIEQQPVAFPFALGEEFALDPGFIDDAMENLEELLTQGSVIDQLDEIQQEAARRIAEMRGSMQAVEEMSEEAFTDVLLALDPLSRIRMNSKIIPVLPETTEQVRDAYTVQAFLEGLSFEEKEPFLDFFGALQKQDLSLENRIQEAMTATETFRRLSPEDARLFKFVFTEHTFGSTETALDAMRGDLLTRLMMDKMKWVDSNPGLRVVVDEAGKMDPEATLNEYLSFRRSFRTEDGKELPAQLDDRMERLFAYAREQGVEVSLAGSDARRALTGKGPSPLGSDIDIIIPEREELLAKGIDPTTFEKDLERILEGEIGLTIDFVGSSGKLTEEFVEQPGYTINHLQLTSDGRIVAPEGFLEDIATQDGQPLIRLFESKRPLEFRQVLRGVRLMAEYPEAAVEQGTEQQLKSFMQREFSMHDPFEIMDLEAKLNREMQLEKHVAKIFLNGVDETRTLGLLREYHLYEPLSKMGYDLDEMALYISTKDEAHLWRGMQNVLRRKKVISYHPHNGIFVNPGLRGRLLTLYTSKP